MKTLVVLFFSLLICVSGINAQDHVFKVLASKSCMLKQGSNWVPLVRGGNLVKSSEVKLADGGYVALLHVTGKTLEIKTPGVFKTDDLASKISTKSLGFSQKYAMFAMNQINSTQTNQQSMNTTGAVTRGKAVEILNPINIIAPQEIKAIKNNPLSLEWFALQKTDAYKIQVVDVSKKVLLEQESLTANAQINMANLPSSEPIWIKVVNKNDPAIFSPAIKLNLVSDAQAQALVGDVEEVQNSIDAESAADNFMLASIFEEKGLLLDALKYYKKSVALDGGIPDYKQAYDSFVKRHNIPQEPLK